MPASYRRFKYQVFSALANDSGVTLDQLSKPGTAQTITAPGDMASQTTLLLAKTAADNAKTSADTAASSAGTAAMAAGTAATAAGNAYTAANAVQTILTGITSLAKWLRGAFRKDALDSTAKSEINTGGGTYDEATDSQEAIRDRGDAAWVTGSSSGLDAQGVRDAMKLAPTPGAPAAGSIDKHLDDMPADVDTALSASHTAGAWGPGAAGIRTVTIITELADHTRVGNVHVAVYNDNGDFIKDITTSSNGAAAITLDDGTFTFPGFLMLYNIAIVSQVISANTTVTITCVPAAEPAPTAGVQTMRFSARAMGASVLDTSAVITATFTTPNENVNGATISSASAAVLNTGTQTWDLPLTIGATARIVGDGANGRFYQKDITVTSAAVSVPSDYD
jgi:hypothetical protein